MVVFPPAGSTDITARLIGQWLSDRLSQQFIIENRPGAGSNLAAETVAKAAPDGYGSGPYMYWELFRSMTAVDMLHVPYRGGGPALTDLLGGQVQAYLSTLISSIQYIRENKLHLLAVTGATRAEVFPDIPTIGEFIPGYEASSWFGISAPKNTPVEIVNRLHKEINASIADPGLRIRFAELGDAVFASSRSEFARLIAEDTEKWAKVIRAANIKAD